MTKSTLILIFSLLTALASAQPFAIPECRNNHFTFRSEFGMGYHLYIAQNIFTGKKDTLLGTKPLKMCFATDSLVTFLNTYNCVDVFKYKMGRWELALTKQLPSPPFQGALDSEGKYIAQTCELLDANHVRFIRTRQKPDGSERTGKEVVYKVDLQSKNLIVEKETKL